MLHSPIRTTPHPGFLVCKWEGTGRNLGKGMMPDTKSLRQNLTPRRYLTKKKSITVSLWSFSLASPFSSFGNLPCFSQSKDVPAAYVGVQCTQMFGIFFPIIGTTNKETSSCRHHTHMCFLPRTAKHLETVIWTQPPSSFLSFFSGTHSK